MQDRKTYAKGSTLESATGYLVKVGMPVVDDTVTANDEGNAAFTALNPITDGQYLVTLEVNGEAIAYKETVTLELGEASVGEYDISYDADYASMGVTANDIVRLLIEPLEVFVSDGFRAAINKAVPKSGGGSGSGGVIVVNATANEDYSIWTLDKTWQEIRDAFVSGSARIAWEDAYGTEFVLTVNGTESGEDSGSWIVYTNNTGNWAPGIFVANSADGYPVSDS